LLAAQSEDVKKLRDLFEATIYEFGLREKERNKLLDSIMEKYNHNASLFIKGSVAIATNESAD
jgi:hypothetical protein